MSIYNSVAKAKVKYSKQDRSYLNDMTCNAGILYPFFNEEILPGDKFKVSANMLIRLSPLVGPALVRLKAFTYYFFVPYRLIDENFEEMISGGEDGQTKFTVPTIEVDEDTTKPGSLADYLGLPQFHGGSISAGATGSNYKTYNVSAYPFRAYNLIYNEYFRDENIDPELEIINPGASYYNLVRKRWTKDYFTSALPWLQRGVPVSAPVLSAGSPVTIGADGKLVLDYGYPTATGTTVIVQNGGTVSSSTQNGIGVDSPVESGASYVKGLKASIDTDGLGIDIQDLRESFQLQRLFERLARVGSRYKEYLRGIFGVNNKDSRLQRPEYLGGGTTPILIDDVIQTSSTDSTSPQGNIAGFGKGYSINNGFQHRFTEHGIVLGLLCIQPEALYYQGLERMWSRHDRFDFFNPYLQHLSEQPIYNKELYIDSSEPDGVFGYTERYNEYRTRCNQIHGDLRNSNGYGSWVMPRTFTDTPKLNSDFLEVQPDYNIFAVTDKNTDHFIINLLNNVRAYRPMSRRGTPI